MEKRSIEFDKVNEEREGEYKKMMIKSQKTATCSLWITGVALLVAVVTLLK